MNIAKALLLIFAIYVLLQIAYSGYFLLKAKQLRDKTFTGDFELGKAKNPEFRLLIAGDSIAAGVGASGFESSAAGQLAAYFSSDYHVVLTNIGETGDRMRNIAEKLLPSKRQNLTLLIVSSNDLLHFSSLENFESDANKALKKYSNISEDVIIIGPGDIAKTPPIPLILKPAYLIQGPKYEAVLKKAAGKYPNVRYISPLNPPLNPKDYEPNAAPDNFHPNDNGHKYWADMIKTAI